MPLSVGQNIPPAAAAAAGVGVGAGATLSSTHQRSVLRVTASLSGDDDNDDGDDNDDDYDDDDNDDEDDDEDDDDYDDYDDDDDDDDDDENDDDDDDDDENDDDGGSVHRSRPIALAGPSLSFQRRERALPGDSMKSYFCPAVHNGIIYV